MKNNTEKLPSSIIEINEHNELVINNKKKNMYKTNGNKNELNDINDSLQIKNSLEHFFISNKVNGSTINILFG